jgi:hypothetical protein
VHGLGSITFGHAVQFFKILNDFSQFFLIIDEFFWRIGISLWFSWKDLDERDLMKFIW